MFLELIATFIFGIGAAGVVLLLGRVTGGRLPKWVMPVAAAAAMIGFTIWSEYTWAARTTAELPEGLAVVDEVSESRAYKPWTYVAPQVTRIVAVDTATMRTRPETPDLRLVDLYLFARWRPLAKVPQLIDCAGAARADVTDAALADPAAATWIALGDDDPLIAKACTAAN